MSRTALRPEAGARIGEVTAGLNYTIDTGVKPVNETFGPGNIHRRTSGETEERPMAIRDGRPHSAEFDLEVTGFEFVGHKTEVRDFFDADELKRVYYPEIEALVKKVSGAARVVVKSQIHAGGRGKGTFTTGFQGGVKAAATADEAVALAQNMLGNVLVTKQTGGEGRRVRRSRPG